MSSDGSTLLFRAVPSNLRFQAGEKSALKDFAKLLSERLGQGKGFCCLITNDKELKKLNHAFLKNNYPTDVLSFPQPVDGTELGEIAISIERAAAQAAQHKHPVLDEVRILMLHGALHLAGMDHERDRGEMARAERKLRAELGLPGSLIERVCQ